MAKQLFEYAVILDGDKNEESKLLVKPTYTLADNIGAVNLAAARGLSDEVEGKEDRVKILVRPF